MSRSVEACRRAVNFSSIDARVAWPLPYLSRGRFLSFPRSCRCDLHYRRSQKRGASLTKESRPRSVSLGLHSVSLGLYSRPNSILAVPDRSHFDKLRVANEKKGCIVRYTPLFATFASLLGGDPEGLGFHLDRLGEQDVVLEVDVAMEVAFEVFKAGV